MSTQTAPPDLCHSAARLLRATHTRLRWSFAATSRKDQPGSADAGSLTIEIRAGDDDSVTAWPSFDTPEHTTPEHTTPAHSTPTHTTPEPSPAAKRNGHGSHIAHNSHDNAPDPGRLEPFPAVATVDRATQILSIDAGEWLSVSISLDDRNPRLLFARTSLLREHGIPGPGTDAPALTTDDHPQPLG